MGQSWANQDKLVPTRQMKNFGWFKSKLRLGGSGGFRARGDLVEGRASLTEEAVLARKEVGSACFKVLPGAEHTPEGSGGSPGGAALPGPSLRSLSSSGQPPPGTRGPAFRPGYPLHHCSCLSGQNEHPPPNLGQRGCRLGSQPGLCSDLSLALSLPWERPFVAPAFVSASGRGFPSLQRCCEDGRFGARSVEALGRPGGSGGA